MLRRRYDIRKDRTLSEIHTAKTKKLRSMTQVMNPDYPLCQLQSYSKIQEEKSTNPRAGYAIRIPHVVELLHYYPYGHPARVMFAVLGITGCRPCELNTMEIAGLSGNWLTWTLGKTQRSTRTEFIPNWLLQEIKYMLHTEGVRSRRLFPFGDNWIRKQLSLARPHLSDAWSATVFEYKNMASKQTYFTKFDVYEYQLKGFRKMYATLMFAKYRHKYGDAHSAMLMVCKSMKHSDKFITVASYIEDADRIEADKYIHINIYDLFNTDVQQTIRCEYETT